MGWVQLAQDGIQWRAPENTVIHLETVKGKTSGLVVLSVYFTLT
jgi:hypothetical protein